MTREEEEEEEHNAAGFIGDDPITNARILIADGAFAEPLQTLQILARAGADVVTVTNGEMARDIILAAEDTERPFDLCITEFDLPLRSGEATATSLRDGGYSGRVIALSKAEGATRDGAEKTAFDAVLDHPLASENLLELARNNLWAVCARGNYFDNALTLYEDGGFGYGNFIAVEDHRFVAKLETITIMRRGNQFSPLIVECPDGSKHHFRYRSGEWWKR